MKTKKQKTLVNPMQPLYKDEDGVVRFKENKIVNFLYDWASNKGMGMNTLVMMEFSQDDREQFLQLIGYSLCGFSEIQYVRDDTYERASNQALAEGLTK